MNKKFLAYVLILIAVVLIFLGYVKGRGSFVYEGKNGDYKFTVEKIEGFEIYRPHMVYEGNEYVYAFRNKPQKLENLYLEENILKHLNRPAGLEQVFITKDINLSELTNNSVSLVTAPMASILGKNDYSIYHVSIRVAFTQFHAGQPIASVVDCSTVNLNSNANQTSAVILLKLGNENRVYSDGECIVVEGKDTDGLIKAGEKFAYALIGVF